MVAILNQIFNACFLPLLAILICGSPLHIIYLALRKPAGWRRLSMAIASTWAVAIWALMAFSFYSGPESIGRQAHLSGVYCLAIILPASVFIQIISLIFRQRIAIIHTYVPALLFGFSTAVVIIPFATL